MEKRFASFVAWASCPWRRYVLPRTCWRICVFALASLSIFFVSACDRSPASPPPDRPLNIIATEFPLGDIAREVGGERVQVDWLINLGDPLLTFALNTSDRQRIRLSDMILCDGARTEPWAGAEVGRLRDTGAVVAADQLPLSHTAPANGILYLDPIIGREIVLALADRLISRRPRYADEFRKNAAAYNQQIDKIIASYPNAAFGRGKLIVLSTLFAPLLDRFGVSSILIEADPLQITTEAIAMIHAKAAENGSRVVLVPFDTPPGTRDDLARRTGLTVFAIDPIGYRNFEQHGNYLDLLRFNLEQLKQASLQ